MLLLLRFRKPPSRTLLIADAFGLALFTISGTEIAEAAQVPAIAAVILGVITGVAGGLIRDLLTGEIPLILRRGHLYASAAILGAALYLVLSAAALPRPLPAVLSVCAIVAIRVLSIVSDVHLPTFALPGEREDRP